MKLSDGPAGMSGLQQALVGVDSKGKEAEDGEDGEEVEGKSATAAGAPAASLSSILPPYDMKTEDVSKVFDINQSKTKSIRSFELRSGASNMFVACTTVISSDVWAEAKADRLFPTLLQSPSTLTSAENVASYGPFVMALAVSVSGKTAQQKTKLIPPLTVLYQLLNFHAMDVRKKGVHLFASAGCVCFL